MKIVVLAGGLSMERDVSFASGSLIANALIENGHEVMLMDLFLGDKNPDFPLEYHTKVDNYKYEYRVPKEEPNLEEIRKMASHKSLVDPKVLDICQKTDKVFVALHGSIGENGELQSLFDIYGINYTGTSPLGCMLAMNKDISKRLLKEQGIMTPKWKFIKAGEKPSGISYPCVVKPCSNGSSVGVTMVNNNNELDKAINIAQKYETDILIEERIFGRELTVGILEGKALPVIEIIPKEGFYDYKNKYQAGLTTEECPAKIDDNLKERLQEVALKVHNTLHLGSYSRVDFIVDKDNNIYVLEANTLPGMTPTSLLPLAAKTEGISYNELCEKILNL